MPKRYFRITPFHRAIAVLLICLEAVVGWPAVVLGQMAQEGETTPSGSGTQIAVPSKEPARKGKDEGIVEVRVNLSREPSDTDLKMARVFLAPLVPVEGEAVEGENAALGRALKAYTEREDKDDISDLEEFLEAYPQSRWRAGLQTNLGIVRRKAGYFTEALERLEEAWELGKGATTVNARAQADRAVGELADLNARFGRYERMAEIFEETDSRDIAGKAQSLLQGAKEGYWRMTNRPSEGFRCGPYAVNAMLDTGKKYVPDPKISKEPSSQRGTNLGRLEELAAEVGMPAVAAQKGARAEWQVPMVIHWKVGHFAAITKKEKGRYLVKDPTFGGEIWVTKKALDEEASGFGLVNTKNGQLPRGWTKVSGENAAEVWGKGGASGTDDGKCPDKTKDGCGGRMAEFNMLKMRGVLEITDFPLGYRPPVGPEVEFMVRYRHLDTGLESTDLANFGPYWTTNWTTYVEIDDGGTVTLKGGDGGVEVSNFGGYSPVTGGFARALYSSTVMRKVGSSRYEREWPDGSKEVFSQPGGGGRLLLKEVVDPHGNKVVLNYDGNLRLTSIVDAIGQATTVSYISDSPAHEGFYKVHQVTDPFTPSRSAVFTYDAGYTRLVKITDVIGIESSFTYGEDGFITRMTTPYGNTDFYRYAPAEQSVARGLLAVLPDGSKEVLESYINHVQTSYYWDRKAMAMAPGDRSKAEETRWLMSEQGSLLMDIPLWRKKALEAKVEFKYPAQPPPTLSPVPEEPDVYHNYAGTSRRPIEIKRVLDDASEQISYFEYNSRGNVTKAIDPAGRTYSVVYAGNGVDVMEVRQTRESNNDLLVKMTYDGKHNMLSRTDASGRTTSYAYNSQSQITSITNPKSEVTTATYDGDGYLTQIDGPLSGTSDRTEATYDAYGRLYTVKVVEGPTSGTDHYTLTYNYDALDRLTQVTFPDSTTEQNVYSRLDLQRSKDRLGRWTNFVHNALGEVVEERDPLGRTTRYEWCRCGALQELIDPAGNLTKWTYDVQGRLTKKTYADSSHEDYEYETNISRMKKITDPAGNITNYVYNIDNTLDERTIDPVSGYADVPDVHVSWDPNYRRVLTVRDDYAEYVYNYNDYVPNFYGSPSNGRGRLSSVVGDALEEVISFEYNELGRITKRQINGTDNESTWAYDAAGRVSSWANALGTFTPTYVNASYGVSRLDNVAFPNGQVVNYDWEANTGDFRLKEIENLGASSTAVSKFTYVTDAASRIREWTQQRGSSTPERYDIGYDAADQVTGAVLRNTSTSAILKQYYYGYDAGSNRTTEQVDNAVTTSAYNNLNQLTGESAGGKTRFRGTIDENGTVTVGGQPAWMNSGTNFQADVNLTTGTNTIAVVATDASSNTRTNSYRVVVPAGGSTTVTYDANGNMLDDDTQTYSWDGRNRLVKTTCGSGASTEYSFDAFGRRVKIVEKNSGGTVTSSKQFVFDGMEEVEQRDGSNVVAKRYFADGWRDVTGSASYFYTKDHLGSIREVVNGSGVLISRYDYDPYGRTTKVSGSVDSDMLYTGHYYDLPSGLYLAMYRAYNPDLARWISRDPIGEAGGINIYGYVSNNPINFWDPLGLDAEYFLDTDNVAAAGCGHAGALIGNDETGWDFFSFGPGKSLRTNADNMEHKRYPTHADAIKDLAPKYEKSLRYPTSFKDDQNARKEALKQFNKNYRPFVNNCGDSAAAIMRGAVPDFSNESFSPKRIYDANKSSAGSHGDIW